jgi:hypothetical protein
MPIGVIDPAKMPAARRPVSIFSEKNDLILVLPPAVLLARARVTFPAVRLPDWVVIGRRGPLLRAGWTTTGVVPLTGTAVPLELVRHALFLRPEKPLSDPAGLPA